MPAESSPTPIARCTRLAPSPTGALHLGNARTFLINWAIARNHGWRIVLRIDDLAGPRIKKHAIEQAIGDLRWLGLTWDDEPIFQTHRLDRHRAAMTSLARAGLVYPCDLTRKQIESAQSAPHDPPHDSPHSPVARHETRFPPGLRPAHPPVDFQTKNQHTNWRFVVPDHTVVFADAIAGEQKFRPADTVGDFVVWTKAGEPAYQLATVVDDHDLGVTDIVRGDDLLDSTARQLLLFDALNWRPKPTFWHLPLVLGPDGRRLAKRHGDTRLSHYRTAGVSPEKVIALLARWSGIPGVGEKMSASQFATAFDRDTMPKAPTRTTDEDDQWLRTHS